VGVDDLFASGAARCFTFFVDMNRIFERFVHRLLADLLDPTRYSARYQLGSRSAVRDAATGEPYSRAIPDVVVEARDAARRSGGPARVAVDAKYKVYEARSVGSRDLYQSFLYAHAFGAGVPPAAVLVYPASSPGAEPLRLRVHNASGEAVGEVSAVALWVPGAVDEAVRRAPGPAVGPLLREVEGALGG
jgi:5-methylcytosine-specific restriction enzyme subunit McrC